MIKVEIFNSNHSFQKTPQMKTTKIERKTPKGTLGLHNLTEQGNQVENQTN